MAINTTQSDFLSRTIGESRENLSLRVSEQLQCKTQTVQLQRLATLLKARIHEARLSGIPSRKRITKALIRLRAYAGWSAPLLFRQHVTLKPVYMYYTAIWSMQRRHHMNA